MVGGMSPSANDPIALGFHAHPRGARKPPWSLSSCSVGALPLLNQFLSRLKLHEFLRAYVESDSRRTKVDCATGLLVLVRNVLLSREPVYGVMEWAAGYAPEHLGLTAAQIALLNDDRIGRCLDRLFDADQRSLLLAIVTHATREFGINLSEMHTDSTTIRFFGDYEDAKAKARTRGKETPAITFGHSKDHRSDLKQILLELTVSRDGGIPVYFTASDGNLTDDQTHCRTWDLLCELIGQVDFLYVADCKLATTDNMNYIRERGGRFVTVLPRTRKEDKDFRERMVKQAIAWRKIHERRNDQGDLIDELEVEITDPPAKTKEGFRLCWYHSTLKTKLDAAARADHLERSLNELALLKAKVSSPRSRFKTEAKIRQAVDKILTKRQTSEWILTRIEALEREHFQQAKPGRPAKGTQYVRSTSVYFNLSYEIETVSLAKEALTDGVFPLVTNDAKLSDLEVLLAYKKQPIIERRFENLKTDFAIAPVFLKSVARVQALLCVYFLALLVEALLEREVRRAMTAKNIDALPIYPERRRAKAPTARRLLDLFEHVQRHCLIARGYPVMTLRTELNKNQLKVLQLLNIDSEGYGN